MASDDLRLSKADLIEVLTAAMSASNKPNAIEQRKLDEEVAAQKRRDLASVQLAKIEEESALRKKNQCSHSRYAMSAGKLGGHAAPRGLAGSEWCTSGQLSGKNPQTGQPLASLVCLRCSYLWRWQPTPQELEYLENSGFLGYAPPPESRLIKEIEVGVSA